MRVKGREMAAIGRTGSGNQKKSAGSARRCGMLAGSALFLLLMASARAEDGSSIYISRCASCHQVDGHGVDGRFPPLNKALAGWLATTQGRSYMAEVVLYGPFGAIQVGDQSYNSLMPALGRRMSDEEIVAALRYVAETLNTAPPGYQPFDTALVSALRNSPTAEDSMSSDRSKLPPR